MICMSIQSLEFDVSEIFRRVFVSFWKIWQSLLLSRDSEYDHHKDCLFNNKTIVESQQRFKSEAHCVYTEEIKKIKH